MKRLFAIALGLTLYAFVKPLDAAAVDAPHVSTCSTCHIAGTAPNSAGFNSNCLSCHSPGNAARNKPFSVTDQANTSHKWSGSDTVPAAGAQPTTTGALIQVQAYTGAEMACVLCHNPHSEDNTKYLRIANDNDQLCLDCHRSRNVQTHTAGSHPVLVAYSSARKRNSANFNPAPLNANPGNPTSDLNARLEKPDGKLLCRTCHGIHSTDSKSSTFDNMTAAGSGDGNLLRTNPRGASVIAGLTDNLNICTNCHTGKVNHNAGGQDIQCNDCHGAHVEYDSDDPAGNKGTNVYLMRRNVVRHGQPGKIFFRYTAASKKEYINTDGTGPGVCQGCHEAPTTGSHTGVQSGDCKNCHTHKNTKGSFSASCTACHGYPPTIIARSGAAHPNNTSCTLCHNTDPAVHNNGTVDVAKSCNGCHGNPPNYSNGAPKANSHSAIGHLAGCNTCHAGTTSSGTTITSTALHMNGVYDLQAGSGASFTYTYAATGGTCSNISCHGGTGATWGSTAACSTCHGYPPPNAAAGYTGVNEATSPHVTHAGSGINYSYACSECHKGNTHGNSTFQDVFIDNNGIIAGAGATYATATRTCSSLYCHSDGTSLASGQPAVASVVWGSNKLACNGCHGNPPAYVNGSPKANSHNSHNFGCSTCHAGTTMDGVTISDKSRHVNQLYDLSPGVGFSFTYTFSASGGTCANISCHNNNSAVWGTTLTCGSCHSESPGGD
ncbi:MAG: cytochrome c3 family protein [Desulfuromonadales bacterium]